MAFFSSRSFCGKTKMKWNGDSLHWMGWKRNKYSYDESATGIINTLPIGFHVSTCPIIGTQLHFWADLVKMSKITSVDKCSNIRQTPKTKTMNLLDVNRHLTHHWNDSVSLDVMVLSRTWIGSCNEISLSCCVWRRIQSNLLLLLSERSYLPCCAVRCFALISHGNRWNVGRQHVAGTTETTKKTQCNTVRKFELRNHKNLKMLNVMNCKHWWTWNITVLLGIILNSFLKKKKYRTKGIFHLITNVGQMRAMASKCKLNEVQWLRWYRIGFAFYFYDYTR